MSTKPAKKKFNPKMLAYLGFLSIVTVLLSFKKISDEREKKAPPTVEEMEDAIRKGSEESQKRLAEYDSMMAANAKKAALKTEKPAVEKPEETVTETTDEATTETPAVTEPTETPIQKPIEKTVEKKPEVKKTNSLNEDWEKFREKAKKEDDAKMEEMRKEREAISRRRQGN